MNHYNAMRDRKDRLIATVHTLTAAQAAECRRIAAEFEAATPGLGQPLLDRLRWALAEPPGVEELIRYLQLPLLERMLKAE